MLQIPQVYRGHFDECWSHFCEAIHSNSGMIRRSRGVNKFREPMRQFCGVTDQSLKRWMREEPILPAGETLMRLVCYLYLHGYKVIEFERLSTPLRGVAEIIGFNLMTAREVCERIGYAQPNTLYSLFWEQREVGDSISENMRSLWKEKREELERRKKEAFDSSRIRIFSDESKNFEPPSQLLLLSASTNSGAVRRGVAISIMKSLLGLFNEGGFDNPSPEELESLSSDVPMILELSSRLSGLSAKLIAVKKDKYTHP